MKQNDCGGSNHLLAHNQIPHHGMLIIACRDCCANYFLTQHVVFVILKLLLKMPVLDSFPC